MTVWNAIPWNTIAVVISLSLLIPSLLAVVFIRLKRFEDLGAVIGVFLLLLGGISYFYVIPTDVVHQATLPENYLWQDEGRVHYWERNSVFLHTTDGSVLPFELAELANTRTPIVKDFIGRETIETVQCNHKQNSVLIHDAMYDENNDVLMVINETQRVSEWYWVDAHTDNLRYLNVTAGSMGIPANSASNNTIPVGWVESNGIPDGEQNVVFVRSMQRVETGTLNGIDVAVWQSNTYNKPMTWHGQPYFCDETLRLTVNPQTGFVVHVYRDLVLSAHLSQFLKLYYPSALNSRLVTTYLRLNDPIGEAAELTYNTTADSQSLHLAEAGGIISLITYIPPLICIPMFIIGFALVWRYTGRSYYWKRYKEYEQGASPNQPTPQPHRLRQVLIVCIFSILLVSTTAYVMVQRQTPASLPPLPTSPEPLHDTIPPTPPGSSRTIDSGRHILVPTDEGAHPVSHREWWYFNVYFSDATSALHNYTLVVSFNKMAFNDIRFLRRDNMFIILYDPNGTAHDFNVLSQRRGTLTAGTDGVSVHFGSSYANGSYPVWELHAGNNGIQVDLEYLADFLPIWVEGRSANLAVAKYLSGDYYIPRCRVSGTITWEDKQYNVSGIGYHDHVWEGVMPRLVTKGWDWANMHFDNGWELYLSKFILRTPGDRYSGALILSPNNRNLTEFNKFDLTISKTEKAANMPLMRFPVAYHVSASRDGMNLSLDVVVDNTCQIGWRLARTGMFEGTCKVTGSFSWSGYHVDLNGYGLSEVTQVKYLLGFFERYNH